MRHRRRIPGGRHPGLNHRIVNFNGYHMVNPDAQLLQALSLGYGAGDAVQDKPAGAVRLGHPVPHDARITSSGTRSPLSM